MSPSSVLGNIAVDVVVVEAEHITERVMPNLSSMSQVSYPGGTSRCVSPRRRPQERAEVDALLYTDSRVIVPASDLQLKTQVEAIIAFASAGGNRALASAGEPRTSFRGSVPGLGRERAWRPDGEHQYSHCGAHDGEFWISKCPFAAYCEAVHEMTRCVSYCLLWQDAASHDFTIVRSEGLPPDSPEDVPAQSLGGPARMAPESAPDHHREALLGSSEHASLLRELEMCGGVLAIPLFCQAALRGIIVIGPKAIGEPYAAADAEALFVLSASAAAAAGRAELHQELDGLRITTSPRFCRPWRAASLLWGWTRGFGSAIRTPSAPCG